MKSVESNPAENVVFDLLDGVDDAKTFAFVSDQDTELRVVANEVGEILWGFDGRPEIEGRGKFDPFFGIFFPTIVNTGPG